MQTYEMKEFTSGYFIKRRVAENELPNLTSACGDSWIAFFYNMLGNYVSFRLISPMLI